MVPVYFIVWVIVGIVNSDLPNIDLFTADPNAWGIILGVGIYLELMIALSDDE